MATVALSRVFALSALCAACLVCRNSAAQPPVAPPDFPGQVMLIRNTLTAVNHGNLTGNYTVLRDLSSERFRQHNTASDLTAVFAQLRQQELDLSPILVTDPKLIERPTVDRYNRMRLVGFVPTRPKAVRFALVFQKANGSWSIDEISVAVVPTESISQAQRLPQNAPQGHPPPYSRTAGQPPSSNAQPPRYR